MGKVIRICALATIATAIGGYIYYKYTHRKMDNFCSDNHTSDLDDEVFACSHLGDEDDLYCECSNEETTGGCSDPKTIAECVKRSQCCCHGC